MESCVTVLVGSATVCRQIINQCGHAEGHYYPVVQKFGNGIGEGAGLGGVGPGGTGTLVPESYFVL